MKKQRMGLMFLIVQAILYGAFLYFDLIDDTNEVSSYIKYFTVILCLCYTLLLNNVAQRQLLFLRMAFLFTLISDVFLLFTDYHFVGVLTFCIAQQFYACRLSLRRERRLVPALAWQWGIMITGSGIGIVVLQFLGIAVDRLLVVSLMYFVSITRNLITSLLVKDKRRSDYLFLVGMGLFFLCDINVGLYNLSRYITQDLGFLSGIMSLSGLFMWTFYAPSQVFIALSGDQAQ